MGQKAESPARGRALVEMMVSGSGNYAASRHSLFRASNPFSDSAHLPCSTWLVPKPGHSTVRQDCRDEALGHFGIIRADIEDMRDGSEIALEAERSVSQFLNEGSLERPVEEMLCKDPQQRVEVVGSTAEHLAAIRVDFGPIHAADLPVEAFETVDLIAVPIKQDIVKSVGPRPCHHGKEIIGNVLTAFLGVFVMGV